MINSRLIWKYFYTIVDCGLILTKPGVSLEKEPGQTCILGSRLLDFDLVAQICSARVLIAGVHAGSDGSGEMGRGAADA